MPKSVEYALKILICLALTAANPVSAPMVARTACVPPAEAAKILHYLTWRGLTRSRRGSRGGYSLRQSPDQVRVKDVMELFQPAPDEGASQLADPLLGIWWETCFQARNEWEHLTIAELAQRTAGKWKSSSTTERYVRV